MMIESSTNSKKMVVRMMNDLLEKHFKAILISLLSILCISMLVLIPDMTGKGFYDLQILFLCIFIVTYTLLIFLKRWKKKQYIITQKIKLYGKGKYIGVPEFINFLTGTVLVFLSTLRFGENGSLAIMYFVIGLVWFGVGYTNIKRGFVVLTDKVIYIKGKDFYYKRVGKVKLSENILILTKNNLVYKYKLENRLTDHELNNFMDSLKTTMFKDKIRVE